MNDTAYSLIAEMVGQGVEGAARLLAGLLIIAFLVTCCVLRSVGLYSIARRRRVCCPWMAWVPLLHFFLLGGISDQYGRAARGKKRYMRWALLILRICWWACVVILTVYILALVLQLLGGMMTFGLLFFSEDYLETVRWTGNLVGYALAAAAVIWIPMTVVRYMALYDLYTSCDPKKSALYLVLSFFFGVTEPFFIFFSREKDGGMPPAAE